MLRLVWLPLLISTVAIDYGAPGLQAVNFLTLFGATVSSRRLLRDRGGPRNGPADHGDRGRWGGGYGDHGGPRRAQGSEELDALQVLGVDPVKNLVVPRFLSLMLVTGLFNIYSILFGLFGGLLAEIEGGGSLGPFWNTLFSNANVTDLWGSVLKTTIFGAIIAIVCCYKGMTASGGAEGVGRAVNEAVVVSFLAFGAFNYVFTQTLLATHPQILVIK